MANFRQYNIQLLPLDTKKTEEVGIEGYKKFFKHLKIDTVNAYKLKVMANQSFSLNNDMFICPFVVNVEDNFAYGKFVKYHKAETVTDFYSQTPLFTASIDNTAVSNTHYFRFVFDYTWHRFGIEENNNRLPSPDRMMKALEHFLETPAKEHFPDYVLKLNLISEKRSLDDALTEGNEFGAIDVEITFPNSSRLNKELKELKDYNIHNIKAHVAPERGARMTGIPEYIRKLLDNAPDYGTAAITYFKAIHSNSVQKFKKMRYSSSENPQRFMLRQQKSEDEYGFIKRAWMYMKALVENNELK